MKSGLVSGALCLVIFLSAFILQVNPPACPPPAAVPRGGAWKAFEWWYAQRAYPGAFIPPKALRNAYDAKKNISRIKNKKELTSLATQWQSIGPDNIGGRVLSIAVHPVNTSTVFVGSASGGLWKTATGGTGTNPWSYVQTGYPTLSVSAIAIDELHPDTMYIGTGEISRYVRPLVGTLGARSSYGMGILKSTDGGTTWDTTGLSWSFQNITAVQEIVINPLNSSSVFAATSEGVYKSTDGGESWTVSNPELMAMDLVINSEDTTILISSHGNLNSTPNPGLYMTFDAGGAWTRLEGGLPSSNFGRTSLSISRSNPAVVYAGISNGASSSIIGLYKSNDGGLTWSLKSTTNYVGSQGWYDNAVEVHPTDPATVYCSGFNLHKSSNSGASLPEISSGSVHVDHHAIVFDPSDPRTIYFGTDGGIYKTTDSGTTFIDLNKGFLTTQFYPGFANAADDSTIALGGLQDNGTLKYIGSPSWIPIWGGDGGWCAIDPTNKNTIYAETQYGRIVRSTSGGGSFSQATVGLPGSQSDWNFIPPFVISPSHPQVLFAGSRNVYKTTNQGVLWSPSNGSATLNGTTISCIGVSWTSPDTLLAGTGSGSLGASPLFQIFASTNGGAAWTNVTGPLPDRYPTDLEFDPSDSRTAYVTYSGYGTAHLFRTTDLGASWTNIGLDLPDLPYQCVAVDPVYSNYLYVGTDLGIFQSSDGGASWSEYTEGMPEAMVLDLTVSRKNDALRAATFGNGIYQRPLPRFSVLSLTYPVGNEILVAGMVERIRWDQRYTALVRIELSTDGGAGWTVIADSVPAAAEYFDWTVPPVETDQGVVKIANVDGGSPADSGLLPFSIIVNPDLLGGWNMVSVPVRPATYLKDSLFPTSVSNAFGYAMGYSVRDTLSNGKSFWLKFSGPQFTDLQGDPIITDSVNLLPGWNMIGSIASPIPVGEIIERPTGLLASLIYAYRKGYTVADTMIPGRGYWVKAGSAGSIVMSSVPFPGKTLARGPVLPGEMNSITVTDASGFSQILYFSAGRPPQEVPDGEMPPVAPGDAPDIRFASGRIAEYFGEDDDAVRQKTISIARLRAPVRVTWSVRETGSEYVLLGADDTRITVHPGEGEAILAAATPTWTLGRGTDTGGQAPGEFRL
ncbi:MAG TPA: hypothetical protein VI932_01145, partial [Bacteroidota bacterium]|nr:hypothetical protein [Bacteroidota bacterium]